MDNPGPKTRVRVWGITPAARLSGIAENRRKRSANIGSHVEKQRAVSLGLKADASVAKTREKNGCEVYSNGNRTAALDESPEAQEWQREVDSSQQKAQV